MNREEALANVKEAWDDWHSWAINYYANDAVTEAIKTAKQIRELPHVRRTNMSWGAIDKGELHASITVMLTIPVNQEEA